MYFLLKIRRCYKSVVKSLMIIKPRIFPRLFFIRLNFILNILFTAAKKIISAYHQKNYYHNSPEYIINKQPYYHPHCNPEHHKAYYSHHRSHLLYIRCYNLLYASHLSLFTSRLIFIICHVTASIERNVLSKISWFRFCK